MSEPILEESLNRLILYPIKYNEIWKMYKEAVAAFWVPNEIDLNDDINDWHQKLTVNERYFLSHILAFFASADTIVSENLASRFYNDVQIPEAKQFYGFQIAMEGIHCVAGGTKILTDTGYLS